MNHTCYGSRPNLIRFLVLAQTKECRVAQVIVRRPFDESNLRNQFGLEPLHLGHLIRGHAAAPVRGLAVRKIDERTS
jgi:hypothetical protein